MKYILPLFLLFPFVSFSQTTLVDSVTGCQYQMQWNCDDCHFSWSGDCTNGSPSGEGVLEVTYQAEVVMKYEGQMENGKFDGKGSYQDGRNQFEGFFSKGTLVDIPKSLYNYFEHVQISESDSADLYVSYNGDNGLSYCAIKPKGKVKGKLVLFPSLYEPIEYVLSNNTQLIELAHEKGLLIIVPSINKNMCLNEPSTQFINDVFDDVIHRYKSSSDNFVFGGFSLGGMNCLRYSELAFENAKQTVVQPKAVFAVDPPVDFKNLHNTEMRRLEQDSTNWEANIVLEEFYKNMGTPENDHEGYVNYSVFSNSEKDGGNVKYLKNLPLRVYIDPDIDWWINERGFSYYDLNVIDLSAMIVHLKNIGNENAELINALGKGYRSNGKRHPHSWSLVDPNDCISWIMEQLGQK